MMVMVSNSKRARKITLSFPSPSMQHTVCSCTHPVKHHDDMPTPHNFFLLSSCCLWHHMKSLALLAQP